MKTYLAMVAQVMAAICLVAGTLSAENDDQTHELEWMAKWKSALSVEQPAKRTQHLASDSIAPGPLVRPKEAGLVLLVECAPRRYLLAEPVYVRCSLVNNTAEAITISYASRYEDISTIELEITNSDGKRIPEWPILIDSPGPQPLTIPPGQRLVEMYNLFDEYGLHEAGQYKIVVRYDSDGRSFNPQTLAWREDLWKGSLEQSLGTVQITQPERDADKAALEVLGADSQDYPQRSQSEFCYQFVFHEAEKRREIIDKHGQSRYAAYARYFEALTALEQFENAGGGDFARPAVALLDQIDTKGYPKLFQEHCRFFQVYAHAAAGFPPEQVDELARKFLDEFPNSPHAYALKQARD